MDLWFLLFLPYFYGHLLGQEQRPPTLLECCSDGKSRGQKGIHCTILPVISSSHLCRIIQEQCCSEVYHSNLCTNGIEMANDQGACERPFFTGDPADTVVSKMCCDCCVIGLLAVKKGLGCNLGLSLVTKCERAALACCTQNRGVKPKHVTQAPVREDSSIATIAEPDIEPYDCRDSSCSQFCNDDGTCSCKDGYKLEADGVSCEDIDECLTDSHNCVSDQMCINTKGSFRCQREAGCGTGYELKDQNSCQDIDECVLGSHNCMRDFVCSNTAGSFRCDPKESCREGFLQDAAGSCIDIDECVTHTSPCPLGQTCINTEGSYSCQTNIIVCGLGYRLTDSMRCEDVDECRRGAEDVCGDHGCVNLVGTYRCVCRPGFTFNSHTRRCEDINECSQFSGRLCAHKCTNVEGSYRCSCTPGFELAQDGRNCQEVNECETSPCSQECTNVYGSYQCYCRHGYQLSDTDGFTCEDIDECVLPSGGQMCSYRCANVLGSFYCTCPSSGYMLAPDRQHCQDIDECVAGIHTCSRGESCFNMRGGFRCLSFQCPPNFRLASKGHRNDGSFSVRCRKACQPYDNVCAVDPVNQITHTVLSMPNFRHLSTPEEIMFLRTTSPVSTASAPAAVDVYFDMHTADEQVSFDVVKSQYDNMIMGVVRQVKPILGPRDIMLEVAMNYVKDGRLSHRGLVVFHIFISEFWF